MQKFDWHKDKLTLDTKITAQYRNTQNVRRFFAAQTGEETHFTREFMAWMKANPKKKLKDALQAYKKLCQH